MRIGLDIDDTMTNSSELIIEYAKVYFHSNDLDYINGILHTNKIEGQLLDFYHQYLPKMMTEYVLKDNVKEVIDRLRKKGHKAIIITARGYTICNGLLEITQEYLKKHNIEVDDMIFAVKEKAELCFNQKIDIMVDDSLGVLEGMEERGVKPLLFTSIMNKEIDTHFDRMDDWLQLEKYIDGLS